MSADIPTLFLSAGLISLLLTLALGFVSRSPGMADLRPWALALLLNTLGYTLYGLRGQIPDPISIIGANTALSLFIAFWILTLARFEHRTLSPVVIYLPVVVIGCAFALLLDNIQMRVLVASPIIIFQMGTMLYLLAPGMRANKDSGRQLIFSTITLTTAIVLIRFLAMLSAREQVSVLTTPSLLQSAFFLTGTLVPIVASLGFVLMMKERSDTQIERGKNALTAIFDSADETIGLFATDGTILQINRRGAERFGSTPEQLVGSNAFALMPEKVAQSRRKMLCAAAASGTVQREIDERNGHTFRTTAYPIKDESERVAIYAADITSTLAAENALRHSEAHFRAFFERSMLAMATVGPDRILAVNPALCDLLGYSRDELLGMNWRHLQTPDGLGAAEDLAQKVISGELDDYAVEKRFLRKDGGIIEALAAARAVRHDDGRLDYVVYLIEDVTERNHARRELVAQLAHQRELNHKLEAAQNQLLQSEKMASIGQLAAGVAHELNNPIGFVHSNLGTLEIYLKDIFELIDGLENMCATLPESASSERIRTLKAEKDFDYLRTDITALMSESKDGLARVRKIVQDLKDFSRVGETNWQLADIHACLDSTLNIVWNELKYKCTVSKDYASDLPLLRCLPSQLNQVFMNLLVNAAQAIENQGEIRISTRRSPTQPEVVEISIADTGKGIAAEHMSHLFEPFFTTKPIGKGTGLGLSIAWGIVARHQGKIEVSSTPGEGTRFTITLPVSPPENPTETP